MKTKILAAIFIMALLCPNIKAQTAREISQAAMDVMKFGSMKMEATLKIKDAKGRERIRQLKTETKGFGTATKTIIKFIYPADVKGTAILIVDNETGNDDMWIYMPALRKTRRIVSSDKGKNFMGSEFTNADMSLPNIDDFNYEILGEEEYEGRNCWKIQSSCKTEDIEDDNGFSRKVSLIDKEKYLCYKICFYDLDDELYKTQIIKDFREQGADKYFAYYMEMINEQNGRRSIMTTDSFQLGSDLDEEYFSPSRLAR